MLKRDTRRHTAKAMLKQSGCYSNTLTYCMYAEDITFRLQYIFDSPLPRNSGNLFLQTQRQCRVLALETAYNRG
ncbi:hypothetical protein AM352_05990 [Citrobacter koseri]|uniref:Uncharacterized protein n=1 Tax=Citrobacter koseri (strain ATCC BAA-895 / CDC 4225-83 / SGSC4696) TaxID=290338 RepID=A8AQQ8_CITK8|nr:hypothetical protein CKO_04776 [Citrobacter koseri ATCC BAA-895]AVE57970.1 hypothetical protein AM352_05990 [Citrobacter koseri]AYY73774.1 hypothetical protein EGX86_07800 [Citrobacter koseri]OHY37780.1 hypothetical protein BBP07_11365 [Citrobacter koseri]PNO79788.1 hypothetical protein MC77_012950 [Citrobacter koseri]